MFDLFITLKTRKDMFMDACELHLGCGEIFIDLFDLVQPRSRLEDLVRHYGMRKGAVHITPPNTSNQSSMVPTYGSSSSRSSGVVSRSKIYGTDFHTFLGIVDIVFLEGSCAGDYDVGKETNGCGGDAGV